MNVLEMELLCALLFIARMEIALNMAEQDKLRFTVPEA